ncbi:MAG: nitrilase-related carbon-nitrogen hydrolase, partial [Cyanobacteriota bacterium]|nr:nitrilase-related carbon-nitrogen hydrolase [Cyanobacteriota bacterium]
MGAGEAAAPAALELAEALGRAIARQGWGLLSGGRPCGVMAAACRGAMAVDGHLVVGVLPGDGTDGDGAPEATAALDVALFTGLGQARNVINVLSSTVVVVCGAGGPGTLSEAAHALRAGRPLLLLAAPPSWRELFAGLGGTVRCCETVEAAIAAIGSWLGAGGTAGEPAAAAAVAGSAAPDTTAGALGAAAASGAGAAGGATAAAPPAPEAPSTTLPVALVQLRAGEEAGANRRHAEAWLERALQPPPGQPAPRLLMLPEIWNAPYAAARFAAYAEPIPEPGASLLEGPSPSLAMVARLARRHGVSVIAGSIPERGTDGRIYNTATVVDGNGVLRARHRKLHLFDVDVPGGIRFRESDSLSGGERLTVLPPDGDPLGTGLAAPPGLGLLICYDIRFPELALLMQQQHGCTLLACPAAFNTTTGPRHWHLLMRAR